jgi:enoyl-CoA hydratase/carnithine racemase
MSDPTLLVERDGDLALLTLNRPEVHNALDLDMVHRFHDALEDLERDRGVGALIITGAGERAFAAGADIAQLKDRDAFDSLAGINQRLFRRIEEFPAPTIAAVRGYALGAGCELALACDLRISGESGRFGQPEVGLGIMPGGGATQRLPRLIGLGRAKELILTGRVIDAREAERIGMVNRVVSDETILDEAKALARQILKQGRLAIRLARTALDQSFHAGGVGYVLESVGQAVLYESDEKNARMERFLERRHKE